MSGQGTQGRSDQGNSRGEFKAHKDHKKDGWHVSVQNKEKDKKMMMD
jgi:hypothetical protein